MKSTFTTLIICYLCIACNSSKKFAVGDDVNKNTYERLLKDFGKTPTDKELATKVKYAYEQLEADQVNAIATWQANPTPENLERKLNGLIKLQQFYDAAAANADLSKLVSPGNVNREIIDTKLLAAEAWYDYAENLLQNQHWQSARAAQDALLKVNGWFSNYKDTKNRLAEATELGIVDAVIAPVRTEGFFYGDNYNTYGNGELSRQLTADLGGRYGTGKRLRVWADNPYGGNYNPNPDIIVEPVWTRWQVDPERRNRYDRNVSKQMEIGRDSLNRPTYRTVYATLHITEMTLEAKGELQIRISDVMKNKLIDNRFWSESFMLQNRSGTYSGDANALSSQDWDLLRSPQGNGNPDEQWLQRKILEKIYPDVLQYLRNQLQ